LISSTAGPFFFRWIIFNLARKNLFLAGGDEIQNY
jgi:hypothetical protein